MGKIRLAIPYAYNEHWIGGTYYIQNLLWALSLVSQDKRPKVILLTGNKQEGLDLEAIFGKQFTIRSEDCTLSLKERALNRLLKPVLGREPFDKRFEPEEIDIVFPAQKKQVFEKLSRSKLVYWIPDLQHKRYPAYFKEEEIKSRNDLIHKMIVGRNAIVFSSRASKAEFEHHFPDAANKLFVLPFAVFNEQNKLTDVRTKYGINEPYFLVANQFWQHKNHIRLFEAVAKLKAGAPRVKFLLTGKMHDYRNTQYIEEVKATVKRLELEEQVIFLGFIPREDQLSLMSSCLAVIQPSLYEGWSTVIEDAKSLGKWVLASDIEVHREQLKVNCTFFDAFDSEKMAGAIDGFLSSPSEQVSFDYQEDQRAFAERFVQLLGQIKTN